MQRFCEARLSIRRVIVSICPLFAILVPVPGMAATAPNTQAIVTNVSRLVGKRAPAFLVTTLDGKPVSLADYRGKALLVNFWATWCGACKLEMPWLAQLREQYAPQGLEIVGIVTDGATEEKVRQIADKYGVKYPVLRCNIIRPPKPTADCRNCQDPSISTSMARWSCGYQRRLQRRN